MYFNALKSRNLSFSTEIGGSFFFTYASIDRFIVILDTFPTGDEKEKLIGAFASYIAVFLCYYRWCRSNGNSVVGYSKLNAYAGKYYWDKRRSSIFILL